jgi:hypothetical protein
MNNLEKLTSIIQELVPEICCQECENGHIYLGTDDNYEPMWGACHNCVVDGVYIPNDKTITIAIVLRAMEIKKNCKVVTASEIMINEQLISQQFSVFNDFKTVLYYWNLAQDDLTLQSEETITNLLKIFEV